MPTDLISATLDAPVLALDVELEPLGSPTFQVTTFANTGPSFYVDREGRPAVVVDSVASTANQMEATVWDEHAGAPVAAIAGLPWVQAIDGNGEVQTTSRTAAHRLNAHAIVKGTVEPGGEAFDSMFEAKVGEPASPVLPKLASVLFELDPLSLVHGIWFPGVWSGRARVARALSGRIDAHDVQSASVQVGGQKTADTLAEVSIKQPKDGDKTVPGEVPVHASEVSAARIVGRLLLDVRTIRSFGLPPDATRALIAVALLEIGEMLASWPRRRSRCALDVVGVAARRPHGFELPPVDDLRALAHAACGSDPADPLVVRMAKAKAKGKAKDEGAEADGE